MIVDEVVESIVAKAKYWLVPNTAEMYNEFAKAIRPILKDHVRGEAADQQLPESPCDDGSIAVEEGPE